MGTSLYPLISASASMGSGPVASLPVSNLWKQAQNRMISAVAPSPEGASNQTTRRNTHKKRGREKWCFLLSILPNFVKKSDFETI